MESKTEHKHPILPSRVWLNVRLQVLCVHLKVGLHVRHSHALLHRDEVRCPAPQMDNQSYECSSLKFIIFWVFGIFCLACILDGVSGVALANFSQHEFG